MHDLNKGTLGALVAFLATQWAGRDRLVVLDTQFGHGEAFLHTWAAWREDPQRSRHLNVVALVPSLPSSTGLAQTSGDLPLAPLLLQAWPPSTPGLHRLSFDHGRVQLLLAPGELRQWTRELSLQANVLCLHELGDGDASVFKTFARWSAPGAAVLANSVTSEARAALRSTGFEFAPSPQGRPWPLARYAPTFAPRRVPTRSFSSTPAERHALVVGAGLAGAATTWALAEQGWRSTLLDRHATPAGETSGNPAGLFHGVVHASDAPHARFNRSASLEAARAVRRTLQRHAHAGAVDGLLRLNGESTGVGAMNALLRKLGLPPEYVQAFDATQASERSACAVSEAAWFYPEGGWVRPRALIDTYLAEAAQDVRFLGNAHIQSLRREGTMWLALDGQGNTIAQAEVVVLANAGDALRLLDHPGWPLHAVRGQLSWMPRPEDLPLPAIPMAGSGYVLPEVDGQAMFGATSQRGDADPSVRDDDHAHNLAQLARLLGQPVPQAAQRLSGRTGWRWVAEDRLPVIGAVPDPLLAEPVMGHAGQQLRHVPRIPGAYVFTALGSRGITWSALGAQVVAAAIAGAPSPIENSLLDAVDPARFMGRLARRSRR